MRDLGNGDATYDLESLRAECEAGIGQVSVVFDQVAPFLNEHLLSMLGLPDAVGGARQALQDAGEAIGDLLGPGLNPVRMLDHEFHAFAERIVEDELDRRYGIDVDQIQDYLGSPSSKMDVGSIDLTLPIVGPVSVQLFRTDEDRTAEHPETDHEKLDRHLGIDCEHQTGSGGALGGVGWTPGRTSPTSATPRHRIRRTRACRRPASSSAAPATSATERCTSRGTPSARSTHRTPTGRPTGSACRSRSRVRTGRR